jgi:hypothetical protein
MKRHSWITVIVAMGTLLWCCGLADLAHAQENLPQLVRRIQPAVVTVITYDNQGKIKGQGSGFFVDSNRFLTNYHVLAGASRVEAKTSDGKRYSVERIVAKDEAGDLVLATTENPYVDIVYAKLKISALMPEVGERVIVVGSPLGLEQTLSEGVVSALRNIPDVGEILQITAPISQGSSGSPVLNMRGEVIGVATFIIKKGQNLNFAIPGSRVLALMRRTAGGVTPSDNASSIPKEFVEQIRKIEREAKIPKEIVEQLRKIERESKADFFLLRGSKLALAGDHGKAVEAFKQGIRINPNDVNAYIQLGNAYSVLSRYQEALDAYKMAIRLWGNDAPNAPMHNTLGTTYAKLGRNLEATEEYKKAIRLKSDYAEAHFNLGIAYLRSDNKGAALKEYKIIQGLDSKLAEKLYKAIYP